MILHALVMPEALLYLPETKGKPFTTIRSCEDIPEE